MSKRKRDNSLISAKKNGSRYNMYFNQLSEIGMSCFKWKGLPSTVDKRYLEMILFEQGKIIVFKDEVLGMLALPFTEYGGFDVYQRPIKRKAYSSMGYNRVLDTSNSVIIYNNYTRTNTMNDIQVFAERLWNLDGIIDVNANAQKTPIIVKCDDTQRLTMLNLYQKYEGNEPFIFGTKGLDLDKMAVFKTDAPYVADKIYQLKSQIWNEVLTFLGISSVNTTKKERLLTDEITRNLGGTVASRNTRLKTRKEGVELINEMFSVNWSVDFEEDFKPVVMEETTEGGEGSE